MNTIARLRQGKKHFEIIVDLNKALSFKKGTSSANDFLEADRVFTDSKKGDVASSSDLKESFGTEDLNQIAEKIVKSGEVLVNQQHRDEESEKRFNQVLDFLSRNAFDPQSKMPHSRERLKSAMNEAGINIKTGPVENQMKGIVESLNQVIPIRIETKKVKITIPSSYAGSAYGVVNEYKDTENWLSNGDLEVVVNVPSGVIMDFYDKLNSISHGSILSEDVKEE